MNSTYVKDEKWYLNHKDKRRNYRVYIGTPIDDLYLLDYVMKNENKLINPLAYLIDICEEGVGLEVHQESKIGDVISFGLKLSGFVCPINCAVRVERISIREGVSYIGAIFINLSAQDKEIISNFINKEFVRQF